MACKRVRPHAGFLSAVNGYQSGRAVELPSRPHAMPVFGCRLPRLATSLFPRFSLLLSPFITPQPTPSHQLHSIEEKPRGEGNDSGRRVDRIRGHWWGSPERSVVAGEPQIEGKAPSRAHIPACDFRPPSSVVNFRSSFLEIPADSRCSDVPVGSGVACLSFRVALRSFVAAAVAVMPVWSKSVLAPVRSLIRCLPCD